ncbi:MAG: SGNH/GDSL hydrolase family protein [Verrucomicrobia bacterium]|nr:SGNH/GDSL hydrolase family protein [Verrucomicrobiota bacterium]MDA0725077.1 SGNH/GDSL hydrolase family protein [Verrucomicrobiota bacterium]MDA1045830.1 SGNH/GDSL hydrolase family protein [Verrucomicrobiota bacterium]
MNYSIAIPPLGLLALVSLAIAADSVTVEGLITPRDDDGMYVRNPDGQFEIEWTKDTQVALEVNTRLFKGLKGERLHYQVQASREVIRFALPKGPITGIIEVRNKGQLENKLKEAREENWIGEHGLRLFFGESLPQQMPTPEDLRFIGLWDPTAKPHTLAIKGTKYEVSLKKGGQTSALLFNVLSTKDCKPFVTRARVVGRKKGAVIVAEEVHLKPIGDQSAGDDPKLPRYLFIGDSISGNYDKGLREFLAGKFNLHHPPTNCGPSAKGRSSIVEWLGAYRQPGRHWDVISFNHGHWDSNNDKSTYRENLEKIIAELKKTKGKLIWVTTCPVPNGYPPAGDLSKAGRAPGRTAGVMRNHLNPWALEVMKKHPGISICDQWQFVKDNGDGLYKDFWDGKNVHFSDKPADQLGEFLGMQVLEVAKTR